MKNNFTGIIALLNFSYAHHRQLEETGLGKKYKLVVFTNVIDLCKWHEKQQKELVAIISESEIMGVGGANMVTTLRKNKMSHIPFFLLSDKLNENLVNICLHAGVAEVFAKPLDTSLIETRVDFVICNWDYLRRMALDPTSPAYKTPLLKRAFDIAFASLALICLSPLLLVVMLLMKLESKGPIFYYSLRIGTGYRVFKFYKFRSMYVNADQRLKELQHLNQYNNQTEDTCDQHVGNTLCAQCKLVRATSCRRPLYADENTWCEKQYIDTKKRKNGAAFVKFKNDPRVTRIGNILRNTSIDELPQLWNVIRGDMSIVGNRPLPLYEAEKLTTDKHALRFLAPAGITGLWQVEKRGKGKMSEEERLLLDNSYAENHSFAYDIKLILKTIPALFQKENV
jgi:lipopolysaccharide/colanic/teichoic acid biosynthesis glycosyltransferase